MSTPRPTAEAIVDEYERRAQEAESAHLPMLLKIGRGLVWVLWAIVVVNVVLLVLAFFLRLLGASTDAAFTEWVYRSTERAMRPFRGIFPPRELSDASVFDASLLFAALFYLFVALGFDALLHWLGRKLAKQQRETAAARAAADSMAFQYAATHPQPPPQPDIYAPTRPQPESTTPYTDPPPR